MPEVTFVSPSGARATCSAPEGTSVMLVALLNGVEGVLAECGGSLACGTCHVYVDPCRLAALGAISPGEESLLDMTAAERRPNSRLSCQIAISAGCDGLIVELPERQV